MHKQEGAKSGKKRHEILAYLYLIVNFSLHLIPNPDHKKKWQGVLAPLGNVNLSFLHTLICQFKMEMNPWPNNQPKRPTPRLILLHVQYGMKCHYVDDSLSYCCLTLFSKTTLIMIGTHEDIITKKLELLENRTFVATIFLDESLHVFTLKILSR